MLKYINKDKKGFTLVELVVVIAILAILAAIAIPAILNIIDSAVQSQGESQAATIDQACKTYYSGIRTGTINSNNFTPEHCQDIIPDKGLANISRLTMAKRCTIAGALEYGGIYSDVIDNITDYGYDLNGHIKFITPGTPDNELGDITRIPEGATTTFEELQYVA